MIYRLGPGRDHLGGVPPAGGGLLPRRGNRGVVAKVIEAGAKVAAGWKLGVGKPRMGRLSSDWPER